MAKDKTLLVNIFKEEHKNPAAVALGRLGGAATKGITSRKKAAAARRNGKKGGRPKKSRPGIEAMKDTPSLAIVMFCASLIAVGYQHRNVSRSRPWISQ